VGWAANLLIGAVAALIVLTLNPPGGWAALVGTALAAGVGGEAVLQSIIASRRAREAEQREEATEGRLATVVETAKAKLDGAAAQARTAAGAAAPTEDAGPRMAGVSGAPPAAPWDAPLRHYVDDAKDDLDRIAAPPAGGRLSPRPRPPA
jgi:hypothetical protein